MCYALIISAPHRANHVSRVARVPLRRAGKLLQMTDKATLGLQIHGTNSATSLTDLGQLKCCWEDSRAHYAEAIQVFGHEQVFVQSAAQSAMAAGAEAPPVQAAAW